MRTTAIMQPTYLPWSGYFDLIDQVDKFVFLDNVQLLKRNWHVRNRIKTAQGELFLTVPIKKTKSRCETILCEALIDSDQPWKEKHIKSIELAYRKAYYFNEVFSFIKELIESQKCILSEYNINVIQNIAKKIGIKTEFVISSKLTNTKEKKDVLLVSICKEVGCSEYISPQGSSEYIEKSSPGGEFTKNGINLFYRNYIHPIYNQLYGDFMPYMSVIDLLFNKGFKNSLDIIRSGRKAPLNHLIFRKDILKLES